MNSFPKSVSSTHHLANLYFTFPGKELDTQNVGDNRVS